MMTLRDRLWSLWIVILQWIDPWRWSLGRKSLSFAFVSWQDRPEDLTELREKAREAKAELALRNAIRRARNGESWDYVKWQWPELMARDEDERTLLGRDLRIDGFQSDIIESAFRPEITELFIKGCTKPGKGFAVALVANVWFDIFPESRVIISSDRIEHAQRVIFAEIASLRQRMRRPGSGTIQVRGISDGPKHYMMIANPQTGEGFSGQHGPSTLFLFDEASAVPDEFYDNAKKQARMIIALSNPRTLGGWFRRAFPIQTPDATQTVATSFGRRRCVTVGGEDCLNVRHKRLEKPIAPHGGIEIRGRTFAAGDPIPSELHDDIRPIIPNQLDYARYRDILAHPNPRHVEVFGQGRFPMEDLELQVILDSWLDRHIDAWSIMREEIPVDAFGLDVAASQNGDETVLAAGGSSGLRRLHVRQMADTMQTVAWTLAIARDEYGIDLKAGMVPVAVDMDGLGKGVGDRLAEQGARIIEIRGNRPADVEPDLYANKRAENYGELARRLDPRGPWGNDPWPMVTDAMLREELTAPAKLFASDGVRFRITPKDRPPGGIFKGETLREKLGRSPDRADAVVYLYAAVRTLDHPRLPMVVDRPLLLVTPEEERALGNGLEPIMDESDESWPE